MVSEKRTKLKKERDMIKHTLPEAIHILTYTGKCTI